MKFLVVQLTTPIIFLLFLTASPIQGQIIKDKSKEYKKDVKRKTERRVDRKVDDAIDAGLDAIFDRKKRKKKKEAEKQKQKSKEEAEAAKKKEESQIIVFDDAITENGFMGSFQLQTEITRDGVLDETSSSYSTYFFDTYQSAHRARSNDGVGDALLLYDLKEKTVTTVKGSYGNRTAVVIKRPAVTIPRSPYQTEADVTRLPTTRTIQGYQCYNYQVQTEQDVVDMWIAEELEFDFRKLLLSVQAQNSRNNKAVGDFYKGITGFPLEIKVSSKINNEVTLFKVKNLEVDSLDPSVFDISDCQITDMTQY